MRYVQNTDADRAAMLEAIGVADTDALFADIPAAVRLGRPLDLPPALSEYELLRHLSALAAQNADTDEYVCFIGAGAYDHYSPALLDQMLLRSEFYTSYTPYQPEVSQGTLQVIYEYQSLICELTGLDVANASLYDGASALAEGAVMAVNSVDRPKVLVASTVNPTYRQVTRTYLQGVNVDVVDVPMRGGVIDVAALGDLLGSDVAAVMVQTPNFFGNLEPVHEVAKLAKEHGALFAVSADPMSLGILAPPGSYGADICIGEGQPLGIPLGFGGPYLGFIAARDQLVRRLPGRIAGATVDTRGQRAFVLTLQAREQHIRRERATSNICTNQGLMALAATIYLTTLGKEGIQAVAQQCVHRSHYLRQRLAQVPGLAPAFDEPFFREFAMRAAGKDAGALLDRLLDHKLLGGYAVGADYPDLADVFTVAVTEKRSKDEMDLLADKLAEVMA